MALSLMEIAMNVAHFPVYRVPAVRRDAILRARWDRALVERFTRVARAQGQTSAEVLRALALSYIASAERPD